MSKTPTNRSLSGTSDSDSASEDFNASGSYTSLPRTEPSTSRHDSTTPSWKKGTLRRKSAWSSWRSYYYLLKDGLFIEFSKAGANKPRKVFNLDQYSVQLAETLTGQPNTFALFSIGIARDPIYFQATEKSDLISWVTAIQPFCDPTSHIDWGKNQLLEALNDPCVMASAEGTIIGVNSSFLVSYGYTEAALIGANVRILMEDQFAQHHDAYLRKYAASGQGTFIGTARTYNVRAADGMWVPSEISLGALPSQKEQKISFIARFRIHTNHSEDSSEGQGSEDISSDVAVLLPTVTASDDPAEALVNRFSMDIQNDIKASLKTHVMPLYQEQASTIETLRKENSKLKRKIKHLRRLHRSAQTELKSQSESRATLFMHPKDVERSESQQCIDTAQPEIGVKLAEGGSGAGVHIAHVDGWQCVVKELQISNMSSRSLTLFEFELATIESLPVHRNLVRYLFHHRTPTKLQIFVTRYDNSLASHIAERSAHRRPYSFSEVTKIMIDIARGVEQLHKRDIIHRDLKSDNIFILLTRDGDISRCVVGDFDSAKRTQDQGAALTLVGTPGYIAPEVFTGERYGPACDIWSLGAILFELMTLERPHKNMPISSFMNSSSGYPVLQLDRSKFGTGFQPLIDLFDSCLTRDPLRRPSISEVIKILVNHFCNL